MTDIDKIKGLEEKVELLEKISKEAFHFTTSLTEALGLAARKEAGAITFELLPPKERKALGFLTQLFMDMMVRRKKEQSNIILPR